MELPNGQLMLPQMDTPNAPQYLTLGQPLLQLLRLKPRNCRALLLNLGSVFSIKHQLST